MNNLFKAFKISIPGQNLDDKYYYDYSDYDVDAVDVPTADESIAKAKAFIRMKQIKRKLSELTIPVYCTVEFGTAGTSIAIPTDAVITVGYISYEPFLSSVVPVPAYETDILAGEGAAAVIKAIIDDAMNETITDEYATTSFLFDRTKNPFNVTEFAYRETQVLYLTADAVEVDSTVEYIQL